MKGRWVISCKDMLTGKGRLYWSNHNGWVECTPGHKITVFNEKERNTLQLPTGDDVRWDMIANEVSK